MKLLLVPVLFSFFKLEVFAQFSELQSLGLPLACFEPGGIYRQFVDTNDCKAAAKQMLFSDRNFLDPAEWCLRSRLPGIRNLPLTTKVKSCTITLDAEEPLILSFSMIRAMFFVSELIEECLSGKKYPLGGRVAIRIGTAYVGIVGRSSDSFALSRNATAIYFNRSSTTGR